MALRMGQDACADLQLIAWARHLWLERLRRRGEAGCAPSNDLPLAATPSEKIRATILERLGGTGDLPAGQSRTGSVTPQISR